LRAPSTFEHERCSLGSKGRSRVSVFSAAAEVMRCVAQRRDIAAQGEYQPVRSRRPHHALVHVFDGDVQGALRLLRRRLDDGEAGLIMRHESRLYVAMTRSQRRAQKSRVARRRRLKTAKRAAQREQREVTWGW
jgi:ribosomal protein S21